jgi:hypothetical protein
VTVPTNYAAILVGLRQRLGLSQQQLAETVGAATKAVVYQWESGKRQPSPVFWLRIERPQRGLPQLPPPNAEKTIRTSITAPSRRATHVRGTP